MESVKQCSECGQIKNLDQFSNCKRNKSGKVANCKDCRRKYQSKWKSENKEILREKDKKYRERTSKQIKIRAKIYRDQNKEYHKKYRADNQDRIKEISKRSYIKNIVQRKEIRKVYRQSFKGKFVEWSSKAKERGIKWDLSFEYLNEMSKVCAYTEVDLTFKSNQHNTISLDRIDSSKGYVEGNVVFCCWYINRMKNNSTLDEFIKNCENIVSKKDFILKNISRGLICYLTNMVI